MDRAGDSSYSKEIALSDCDRTHDSRRLVADENEYFATSFVVQTLAASSDNVANNPEGTSRKSLNCNASYTAMELIPSPHSDQADPRYFPRRSLRGTKDAVSLSLSLPPVVVDRQMLVLGRVQITFASAADGIEWTFWAIATSVPPSVSSGFRIEVSEARE